MKKNFLYVSLLALSTFGFASCSSSITGGSETDAANNEGILIQMVGDNFDTHKANTRYFLETEDAVTPIKGLNVDEGEALLGKRVRFSKGNISNGVLSLSSSADISPVEKVSSILSLQRMPGGETTNNEVPEQKTHILTVRLSFSDKEPLTSKSHMRNILNGSIVQLRNLSHDQVIVSADADGDGLHDIVDLHIDQAMADCLSFQAISDYWKAFAPTLRDKHGVDFSQYQHVLYYFPKENSSSCEHAAWAGAASSGHRLSTQARNIAIKSISGSDESNIKLAIHEIGHTLGLRHSNGDFNNDGNIDTYGDHHCLMGGGKNYLSPIWLEQLGVVEKHPSMLHLVEKTETINIVPLSDDPTSGDFAQIAKTRGPGNSIGQYYYATYRKTNAGDRFVDIHLRETSNFSPALATANKPGVLVKSLTQGESFSNESIGLEITFAPDVSYGTVSARLAFTLTNPIVNQAPKVFHSTVTATSDEHLEIFLPH